MDDKEMMIDKATQAEVISQLIEKVKKYYVFPDIAEKICAHMEKTHQEGEYIDLTDGNLFALGLTIQLQEINHDEHLWVKWHPETLPMVETLRLNPYWRDREKSNAKRQNFGIYKIKVLTGNVGYLDIHYLHRPAWAGEKIVKVAQFLAPARSVILDLRKCTGGYPHMIALVCSYLFGEDPIHLFSIYWRDEDVTQQYWTLPYVPGHHFAGKPIYVLTSQKTFSGGEVLAEVLKCHKRAIIIGEKTDGGTHPGASYYLHPHFEAFIPIGRMINPFTGGDWEEGGVTPDILRSGEQSFNTAYRLALLDILSQLELRAPRDELLIDQIRTTLKDL